MSSYTFAIEDTGPFTPRTSQGAEHVVKLRQDYGAGSSCTETAALTTDELTALHGAIGARLREVNARVPAPEGFETGAVYQARDPKTGHFQFWPYKRLAHGWQCLIQGSGVINDGDPCITYSWLSSLVQVEGPNDAAS